MYGLQDVNTSVRLPHGLTYQTGIPRGSKQHGRAGRPDAGAHASSRRPLLRLETGRGKARPFAARARAAGPGPIILPSNEGRDDMMLPRLLPPCVTASEHLARGMGEHLGALPCDLDMIQSNICRRSPPSRQRHGNYRRGAVHDGDCPRRPGGHEKSNAGISHHPIGQEILVLN